MLLERRRHERRGIARAQLRDTCDRRAFPRRICRQLGQQLLSCGESSASIHSVASTDAGYFAKPNDLPSCAMLAPRVRRVVLEHHEPLLIDRPARECAALLSNVTSGSTSYPMIHGSGRCAAVGRRVGAIERRLLAVRLDEQTLMMRRVARRRNATECPPTISWSARR